MYGIDSRVEWTRYWQPRWIEDVGGGWRLCGTGYVARVLPATGQYSVVRDGVVVGYGATLSDAYAVVKANAKRLLEQGEDP